jgi:methionyl-tRNA formyltransferase
LILPPAVLAMPTRGCINIHASLLPRWRGAAPIHRAIAAGDAETGVCIMQMEAGLDTGPVYARASLPITTAATTATLHDQLAALGGQMMVAALPGILAGTLTAQPQAAQGVTYAAKIEKSEAPLDWQQPAATLARQVRAFNPFPGATLRWQGQTIKVFSAHVAQEDGVPTQSDTEPPRDLPGAVLHAGSAQIVVQCGSGALVLTEIQKPGGRRETPHSLLQGSKTARGLAVGDHFE